MIMSKSSSRWLSEHDKDIYVRQALLSGYRSRSVYKLAQIDERDHLFRKNMTVVDLGSAPGGWSQWVQQKLSKQVKIFALDILPMDPLENVTFIQGDFRQQTILDQLLAQVGRNKVDLVMSDMSPNITGMKAIDQPNTLLLTELARNFALNTLADRGNFLVKVFQGQGVDNYVKNLRSHFKQVVIRKPAASRSRSTEVYVLAKYFSGETIKEIRNTE
jgi:23S rRNA (uridine2552-2'-O)-methyltransferase